MVSGSVSDGRYLQVQTIILDSSLLILFTNSRPGLFTYLLTRVDALKDLVWSNIQPFQAGMAKVKSLIYPYLKMIFCSVVDPALWVLANARL